MFTSASCIHSQTKTADAASGPGDGDSGMLRGLDGVGAGGTGGAANEDRRQQAAEAVAARLRQEVEPVTRALAGVQVGHERGGPGWSAWVTCASR